MCALDCSNCKFNRKCVSIERVGEGVGVTSWRMSNQSWREFLVPSNPLTNFQTGKYYQHKYIQRCLFTR